MKRAVAALFALVLFACARPARAFVHVVAQGEGLAQLAARFYGSAHFESVLVAANGLDARGGSAVVAGFPLEVPAPSHHKVEAAESWAALANRYLGDGKRADVLARANGTVAWQAPTPGQEIAVPAVIAHLAGEGQTMGQLAGRYYGDPNRSWQLNDYNGHKGDKVARGTVVLVPLLDLTLTEEGKRAARQSAQVVSSQGEGFAHDAQKSAEPLIPPLLADVRAGRYVDAVAKGNRLLGLGELTKVQLATIHRALVEAYVALDAWGAAAGACQSWRSYERGPLPLDARRASPKIRKACGVP